MVYELGRLNFFIAGEDLIFSTVVSIGDGLAGCDASY